MKKLDLYKKFAREYKAGPQPAVVKISRAYYLAIDGAGAPASAAFTRRLDALYNMAHTLRTHYKNTGHNYVIGKLEALWWVENGGEFELTPTQDWRYTLMVRTPDFVSDKQRRNAMEMLIEKGKPGEIVEVRLMKLAEGICIQALHIGPYDAEQPTLMRMRQLARQERLAPRLQRHEIYLSDPRRVEAAKLRTILRQPVG